jgi:hypothetical protein
MSGRRFGFVNSKESSIQSENRDFDSNLGKDDGSNRDL